MVIRFRTVIAVECRKDYIWIDVICNSMKKFATYLLLLISLSAFADFDPVYCFKGTVTTKGNRTITGYFISNSVFINYDEQGYFYGGSPRMRLRTSVDTINNAISPLETEYHFFNEVKRRMNDTLSVYADAVFIPHQKGEASQLAVFFGREKTISPDEVDYIIVHAIYTLAPVTSLVTKVEAEDRAWIARHPVRYESIGGIELCNYDALSFDADKENAYKQLQEFKNFFRKYAKEYNANLQDGAKLEAAWEKFMLETKRLRSHKILVVQSCSC